MSYRVCTKCDIHHIENCGTCWGFGVEPKAEGDTFPIPISAGRAIDGTYGAWIPCPECGSTPSGINVVTEFIIEMNEIYDIILGRGLNPDRISGPIEGVFPHEPPLPKIA